MLQLKILSGKMAGTEIVARRFPFSIGREKENDLVLEDAGVFERHAKIELRSSREFFLQTEPNTFVAISGQQNISAAPLKNADLIEVGTAKLLFSLSPTRQQGLAFREIAVWIALALLTLAQFALIGWLLAQ